ncbi:MAG: hypothetical protein ACN6OC_14620 [Alcaligenes sp.]
MAAKEKAQRKCRARPSTPTIFGFLRKHRNCPDRMRFFAHVCRRSQGFYHAGTSLLSKARKHLPKKKTASQVISLASFSSVALAGLIMSSPSWAEKKSNIEPAAVVGHYYMEDVDGGVNSELQLTDDHRFKFGMGYGAALTYTQGSWQMQGDQIELASAPARAGAFENRSTSP